MSRKAAVPTILVALSVGLVACAGQPGGGLPASFGGLPEDAPPRPATIGPYPAVHDIPAAREKETLTDTEQKKLENDLVRTRDRLSGRAKSDTSGPAAPQQAGGRKNP